MKRLDAINQMLAGIGEPPVSTENSQHPDVLVAKAVLDRVMEQVQERGWWFNTDPALSLSKDISTNEILLPSNALKVDPTDVRLPYVRRGTKLYDPVNSTFKFTDVDAVECKLVSLITFDELPISAQVFIAAQATYDLHLSEVGDENKLARLEKKVTDGWAQLNSAEITNSDYNAQNTPTAVKMRSGIRPYRRG